MKVFFGWCLMAVGALITLTCGLCTLGFVVVGATGAAGPRTDQAWFPFLMMTLIVGLPPTAGGIGLIIAGRQLIRGPKSQGVAIAKNEAPGGER